MAQMILTLINRILFTLKADETGKIIVLYRILRLSLRELQEGYVLT